LILSGSYGTVLASRELPPLDEIQREIDRQPCLFAPRLVAMRAGILACRIDVRGRIWKFGYEIAEARAVIAPIHARLAQQWSRAFVFRDDGSTIGGALSGMVGEAAARSMNGVLYDRERGVIPDYGDLMHLLDGFLSVELDDQEAYWARYPNEQPRADRAAERVVIEARVFAGQKN
jgi:hypothetical protein